MPKIKNPLANIKNNKLVIITGRKNKVDAYTHNVRFKKLQLKKK